ncbi:MAG: C4-dicarboxylate-binding protein DctP [Pseudohongiellaceae bacterium]|jgi:C4-dicarboxylate-binding protein DctP
MNVISLVRVGILVLWLVAAGSLSAEPITIRFSHIVAEDTPKGLMALKFKELVNKRLAGKVNVKVYPNSILYGDGNVLEAMLLGNVELAAPSLSKFQRYTKKLQVFDLPFLFRDMDAVDDFQRSEAGRKLLDSLEGKMLVGLGYLHNGFKQITSNGLVRVPADLSGGLYRIQSSDVIETQFKAVGALPLKKSFSDTYRLLKNKSIDGTENTWSNIYSQRYHEVQNYILESNHGVLDYLVVTSAEFWFGLPDDTRIVLKRAIEDSIAFGNRVAQKKAKTDRAAVIAAGEARVVELYEYERQQWLQAMIPVWKKFEDDIGQDLIGIAVGSNAVSK